MSHQRIAFCNLRENWAGAHTLSAKMDIASSVYSGMGKSSALTSLLTSKITPHVHNSSCSCHQHKNHNSDVRSQQLKTQIHSGISVPKPSNAMDIDINAVDRENVLSLVREICQKYYLCYNCLKPYNR